MGEEKFMSPSPYFKKGEVSRQKAEDRIREDIIVKCKVCGGIMKFYRHKEKPTLQFANYWHCAICLRNIVVTQL